MVKLRLLNYILNVPAYFRKENDYQSFSWIKIAEDIGIGKSWLDRTKRTFHPLMETKHIFSDMTYIVFNYPMEKSVPLLKKYLVSLNIQPSWSNFNTNAKGTVDVDEYIGNLIEKFTGVYPDNEGQREDCYPEVELNNLDTVPGYILTPLSEYEKEIKKKRQNGYINYSPTIYEVHIS